MHIFLIRKQTIAHAGNLEHFILSMSFFQNIRSDKCFPGDNSQPWKQSFKRNFIPFFVRVWNGGLQDIFACKSNPLKSPRGFFPYLGTQRKNGSHNRKTANMQSVRTQSFSAPIITVSNFNRVSSFLKTRMGQPTLRRFSNHGSIGCYHLHNGGKNLVIFFSLNLHCDFLTGISINIKPITIPRSLQR